jgi:16S rRNA (guanine1207-N2)-methyltransferase
MGALAGKSESAIVFLPKSKPLIDMTLALISGTVERDGVIVLVGEKDAGIESAKKIYEKNIGPIEQKIVGNHSALYIGKNKKLGADKKVEDYLSYSKITWENIQLDVANLPGIFSSGELDEGTKLLLEHIPYDKKKVLDIGSGSGVIGAIYKKKNSLSDITMTDWSKLAVLASKKTLEINNLNGEVIESNVFDTIKGKFDLIITNPPFHKGIDTDYSFIEKFARDAKSHLNPNGEVYVVANSFLPYKEILEKHIGSTQTIEDNKKYKVFRSHF